jgi:hypothetical protein
VSSSDVRKNVALEWRGIVVSDAEEWHPTDGERPGGESGGFFVRRTKDGALAFLKPNHPSFGGMSTVPAAALEKIAADLAFDLSLPVPPVVLVDGTKVGGKCAAAALSR